MKIAIATEGNVVSEHFGRCENFTIVNIQDSSIKEKTVISTEGNQHGLLPEFLSSQGVQVVIAGGMGEGARQNLISSKIEIISGINGNIDEVIKEYLSGNLKSIEEGCAGHGDQHEHGSHGCNCGNHN